MNLFGKRLGRGGQKPADEIKKTKGQRLSATFLSPSYLVSVVVLICAAMPAFKVPVNSFGEGALGTLTRFVQHAEAPDWGKRFGSVHWPKIFKRS